MLNIALLDDDKTALIISKGAIESFLENRQIAHSIDAFSSSLNLLASIKEKKYQLFFLDIDVPEINGLETAKRILEVYKAATIIFLSQREDLVFECLALHPFGFIRKSKLIEDFGSIMSQYLTTYLGMGEGEEKIAFEIGSSTHLCTIREIVYIEGDRNYQKVVLSSEEVLRVREPLGELEKRLQGKGLIRTHKGFLVNYLHIRSIQKDSLILVGGKVLPIAKNRRDEVMKEYLALSRKDAFQI